MATTYNPSNKFEIKTSDVEFRKTRRSGLCWRGFISRRGRGRFRCCSICMAGLGITRIALPTRRWMRVWRRSGIVVVAIDLTRAPEAPYPASVQDANYGVRWLKCNAYEWNGDAATIGVLGSSSGGHEVELLAMRPDDPRYKCAQARRSAEPRCRRQLRRHALAGEQSLCAVFECPSVGARRNDAEQQELF